MGKLRHIRKIKDVYKKEELGISQETALGLLCRFCKKIFHSKYSLDRHSKIHLGEEVSACEMCGKILYNYLEFKDNRTENCNLLKEVGGKLPKDELVLKNYSHSEGSKVYICEFCKHRSVDETAFAIHCSKHRMKKLTLCYKCSQM